jgi:hypothetical protein
MLTKKRFKQTKIYNLAFIGFLSIVTVLCAATVHAQVEGNRETARIIRANSNRAWDVLFIGVNGNNNGTIFAAVLSFMAFFTFVVFCVRLIVLYREVTKDKPSEEFIQILIADKIIPIGLVFVLLGGGGILGSLGVISSRNAVYNLESQLSAKMVQIAQTNKIAGEYQGQADALERLRKKQSDCSILTPEVNGQANPALNQCIDEFQRLVNNEIDTGAIKSPNVIAGIRDALNRSTRNDNSIVKVGAQIGSFISSAPSSIVTIVINGYLLIVSMVFSLSIEASMLIMGLIAPIAISLSLIDLKPLTEWITKFAGLGIAKVSYVLALGIFQIMTDVQGGNIIDGLSTWLIGIGAPFIAILAAIQTGGIIGAAVEGSAFAAAGAVSKFLGGKAGQLAGKVIAAGAGAAAKSKAGGAIAKSVAAKANRVRQ